MPLRYIEERTGSTRKAGIETMRSIPALYPLIRHIYDPDSDPDQNQGRSVSIFCSTTYTSS